MSGSRPLPHLEEPDSAAFWQATAQHSLTYQICSACGTVIFYPRKHCTNCGAFDLAVAVSAGRGTVYTYSVIRRSAHPYFKNHLPYSVAWIDLDEGFRMLSSVVGSNLEALAIGSRVRVVWEDHDGLSIPLFELDADVGT